MAIAFLYCAKRLLLLYDWLHHLNCSYLFIIFLVLPKNIKLFQSLKVGFFACLNKQTSRGFYLLFDQPETEKKIYLNHTTVCSQAQLEVLFARVSLGPTVVQVRLNFSNLKSNSSQFHTK